jgi:aldehyde dehydrogenase (NAD+)
MNRTKVFIGGQWQETVHGKQHIAIDPATEQEFGRAVIGTAEDADAVVAAAQAAFPAWAALSAEARADVLEDIALAWERRGEEVARLVSMEVGMPLQFSIFNNVLGPVATLRYYAALARGLQTEEDRTPIAFHGKTKVRKNPVGVVAAIIPWNFPLMLMVTKIAPALAAGCTVVVKPAEQNALSAHVVSEIMAEAGVPAGVVNIVAGNADFASAVVAHQHVAKVAFTGSTPVGRTIAGVVGQRLGETNLELGGKSAAIVLDDADLDHTLAQLPPLSFMNSGQTCFAQTRVIATPGIYDAVVDGYARYAERQVLGSPLDEQTTMGPVISAEQRGRVHRLVSTGIENGARLVSGGLAGEVPDSGFYVAPTVFADVDNSWEIAQEEIFGPVVCIIPASDEADAVRLANDSVYGLAGSVWTRNEELGHDIARQVEVGSFGINGYLPDPGAPWGGLKASGSGRENGPEAVDSYLRADTIYHFEVPSAPGP